MALLNNFGAVFTFAIKMETAIQDYHQQLGHDDLAKESKKRIEKFERARREYVVEITLEPIDDLDGDDYQLNVDDTSESGQNAINSVAHRFYNEAAPKINVRQAQRILEKCGKQYA